MRISGKVLKLLSELILGGGVSDADYKRGPRLVDFFNELGFEDYYDGSMKGRRQYVDSKLKELNNTERMKDAITEALKPNQYGGLTKLESAAKHLNELLKSDGYELRKDDGLYVVTNLRGGVALKNPLKKRGELDYIFIDEQIKKCDDKLRKHDYDGAITNARSLVEAFLRAIEKELARTPQKHEHDLTTLYKKVRKLLQLDHTKKGISSSLRCLLSGLINIIQGLAEMRNACSDSHLPDFRAEEHHAELAVNAAKTFCIFIYATFERFIEKKKS